MFSLKKKLSRQNAVRRESRSSIPSRYTEAITQKNVAENRQNYSRGVVLPHFSPMDINTVTPNLDILIRDIDIELGDINCDVCCGVLLDCIVSAFD